ncbi:MAG: hypothetical protein KatS3mg061_2833 [Dehalococcoidia bacterium]|nr:MAG: hypothetical protein KatS3mg061_2833 [Dehalococcoidia bacterium]
MVSRRVWLVSSVLGGVLLLQGWIATAGRWSLAIEDLPFRYTTTIYAWQAEAFAAGQLHLRLAPPAELAHLPDPYDPAAREPFHAASDLSYFAGRYWLYFGPVPALAILLPQQLTGQPVADSVITLLSVLAVTLAGTFILLRLQARLFPIPLPVLLAAVLALGLNGPLLLLLSSPAVHEAATAAGQATLLLGVLSGVLALTSTHRGRWILWALAGSGGALALGSRLALAPAVVGLALAGAGLAWRWERERGARGGALLALVLPLALGLLLLGWYNWARFGTPFETGHRYQLTSYPLLREYAAFATPTHVLPNLGHFLLQPPRLVPEFPFLSWVPFEPWNATLCSGAPGARIFGPTIGLFPLAPFCLLAGLGPWLAWRGCGVARRAGWASLLFGTAAALAALPVLLQRWVTTRYEADFALLLVLAASAAAAGLTASYRWLGNGLALGLAGLTAGAGVALGMSGSFGHFARHHPELWQALAAIAPPSRLILAEPEAITPNLRVRFGEQIEVAGALFTPDQVEPGARTLLRVWYRAPRGAVLFLRLRERSGGIVLSEQHALPPAASWREAQLHWRLPLDYTRVRPPDYLLGELAAALPAAPEHLLPARDPSGASPGEWVVFGPLRLGWPFAWPPTGALPRSLAFGDQLQLAGLCLAPVGWNGGSPAALKVLLFWTALAPGPDRTLQLEVLAPDGRLVASARGQPGDGLYRTGLWRVGERIEDEWEIGLSPLPAGEYRLRLTVEGLAPRGDPIIATFSLPGASPRG